MRDYHEQRREREPLVREIYGLGLSAREISEITEWSEATLAQDIRRFGGLKAFPNRPKQKWNVFSAVIRRYAEIMIVFTDNEQKVSEEANAVRQALAAWLREDLILAMLHGLEFTLEQLTVPVYPRERKNHARLLGVILGVVVGDPCNAESWPLTATKLWWHSMLVAIHSGEETTPQSRKHLGKMLVRRVLVERRAEIMPIWDESVIAHVDDLLGTLTEREHKVICERFGIGVKEAKTLEQVASEWECTRERLRQIEAKAIRKLRTQAHKRHLGVCADPVGNALQRELAQRKAVEEATQQPVVIEPGENPAELLRGVDELELSVAAFNCLSNENIVLIGELVQRTEPELLRTKNFGRKRLIEIKSELGRLGLALGMEVGDGLKSLLDQRKRELAARASQNQ